MADDEISVTIDGDETQTDQHQGESSKDADAVADLKSQLDALKAQSETERSGREAAERRANQEAHEANRAREEVRTARTEIADRELDTIVSGIAAATAEAEAAQKDYEAAAEAGDFKKQAEAQRRMARAEQKIGRLDEAKADIEVRRADQERSRGDQQRGRDQTRQERTQPDPVESVISQLQPQTQAWLRKNADYGMAFARDVAGRASGDDIRKANKVRAAHSDALAEGIAENSPEYFAHIETFLELNRKEQANGAGNRQQTNGGGERQRRQSPPTAPVSNVGAGSSAATEVRLSAGEARAATDGTLVWNPGNTHPQTGKPIERNDPLVGQPIGHREMAKRKLYGQRNGLYDRVYVEQ
jgi:hypothetical protein